MIDTRSFLLQIIHHDVGRAADAAAAGRSSMICTAVRVNRLAYELKLPKMD